MAAEVVGAPCTHYASPAGKGNGKSPGAPFPVATFWTLAKPGDTLCLLNGTYRGDSLISPPSKLSGSPDAPITIRALYEGKVLLDGEGKKEPVRLASNDWFVVEGVNACCSGGTVVLISRSSHDIIRRVAAWDAADGNESIFGVHYHSDHNLLEDVAGWGIARKIYESSQGGNFTIIRRAWGRWEGSHVIGPKMVYTLAYNNYDMLVENAIGTWSGEKMKRSYVLLGYDGKPWVGRGEGTYQNYEVDQPYGVFAVDRLDRDKNARARLLGSIAYITAHDSFKAPQLVLVTKLESVEIADTLAYAEPGSYPRVKTFALYGLDLGGAQELIARNLTGIGGAAPVLARDWQVSHILHSTSTANLHARGESIFKTSSRANLCYRYVDGLRTTEPLWPWPMNQRIIDAMIQSGRQPVDVTATVESLFGPIPTPCRSTATEVR